MRSWSDLAPIFIRRSGYRAKKKRLLQKMQAQLLTSKAAFLYSDAEEPRQEAGFSPPSPAGPQLFRASDSFSIQPPLSNREA